MTVRFTLITLLFFLVTQCTVERRLYNKGLHIEWHKKKISGSNKVTEDILLAPEMPASIGEEKMLFLRKENNVSEKSGSDKQYTEEELPGFNPGGYKPESSLRTDPPSEDTIRISVDELGGKSPVTDKDLRDYAIFRILLTIVLLLLIGVYIASLVAVTDIASAVLGILGLFIIVPVFLIILVLLHHNRPDRRYNRRLEKAIARKQREHYDGLSKEEKEKAIEKDKERETFIREEKRKVEYEKKKENSKKTAVFAIVTVILIGSVLLFKSLSK